MTTAKYEAIQLYIEVAGATTNNLPKGLKGYCS